MTQLFGRAVSLQVGTIKLTTVAERSLDALMESDVPASQVTLDLAFEVEKSLSERTPNSAQIQIWNLNAAHRKEIQESPTVFVDLSAGYESGMSLIFRGDLREAHSFRDGPDWVTTITAGTGDEATKKRVRKSFAPGASVREVIAAAADALGVGLGNASKRLIAAKTKGNDSPVMWNGYTLYGNVKRELTRVLKSCGLTWSIQDGELQIIDMLGSTDDIVYLLSPETGLVGSPERGSKGATNVRSLILPDIYPGRRVKIESANVNGVFRVETARHTCDTAGRDWYCDMELKEL